METWRNYMEAGETPRTIVFLDMDGVLVNFTKGLVDVLNHDIESDIEYPRSRGKKLRKVREYNGPDKVFPITEDFMVNLMKKKDSGTQLSQWELLIKRYQFAPVTKNYDHWLNLPKASGADQLIQGCFDLVVMTLGKRNLTKMEISARSTIWTRQFRKICHPEPKIQIVAPGPKNPRLTNKKPDCGS